MSGLTLPQKVWDAHVVRQAPGEPDLLYIDLHLVHEVTSPQAFDGLRLAGRRIRRPDLTIATEDHNVPTADIDQPIADPISARQVEVMRANAAEFDITLYPMGDARQGIVHVIGPEQGRTLPGMTIVCGDSHTATHGAFGALAFGIGTSEVEHVLATQTLPQVRPGLDGHRRRRRAAARRHRQGRDPGHHRPHRDRRRDRPRHRVPRRGHPLAVDGGPDDGLQHVDRGRCPGRARGPGRHDVRLPGGPGARAVGPAVGRGASSTGGPSSPTRTRPGTSRSRSTPGSSVPRSAGAPTPAR